MDDLEKPDSLLKTSAEEACQNQHKKQLRSLLQDKRTLKKTLDDLISNANHNQNTQEKFYQLELFFLESVNFEQLINRVLHDLIQKLRLTQVELLLLDPEGQIQQLISEVHGNHDQPHLHYVSAASAIKDKYDQIVELKLTQQSDIIASLFSGQQPLSKSCALLPLIRAGRLIGSLHLGSSDKNRFHSGLAINFLSHLCSIISVCIENMINQERYIHLSLTDMLTRTKNRRYFFQALAREIARAGRSLKPICCLFIDIDHFKRVNDQYGHTVGDNALVAATECIQTQLRQSDILARFGGEEFTVLLPDCDKKQAFDIAQRIRRQVNRLKLDSQNQGFFELSVSIGISHWQPDLEIFENAEAVQNFLINAADQSVYQAKHDGRNCVRSIPVYRSQ